MGLKRRNNHKHAKRRAMERYGIVLNQEVHRAIVEQIQRGDWLDFKRLTNSRTRFEIGFQGKQMRVIYDKNQHNLVTMLPPRGA
jgi:hypothetical protein